MRLEQGRREVDEATPAPSRQVSLLVENGNVAVALRQVAAVTDIAPGGDVNVESQAAIVSGINELTKRGYQFQFPRTVTLRGPFNPLHDSDVSADVISLVGKKSHGMGNSVREPWIYVPRGHEELISVMRARSRGAGQLEVDPITGTGIACRSIYTIGLPYAVKGQSHYLRMFGEDQAYFWASNPQAERIDRPTVSHLSKIALLDGLTVHETTVWYYTKQKTSGKTLGRGLKKPPSIDPNIQKILDQYQPYIKCLAMGLTHPKSCKGEKIIITFGEPEPSVDVSGEDIGARQRLRERHKYNILRAAQSSRTQEWKLMTTSEFVGVRAREAKLLDDGNGNPLPYLLTRVFYDEHDIVAARTPYSDPSIGWNPVWDDQRRTFIKTLHAIPFVQQRSRRNQPQKQGMYSERTQRGMISVETTGFAQPYHASFVHLFRELEEMTEAFRKDPGVGGKHIEFNSIMVDPWRGSGVIYQIQNPAMMRDWIYILTTNKNGNRFFTPSRIDAPEDVLPIDEDPDPERAARFFRAFMDHEGQFPTHHERTFFPQLVEALAEDFARTMTPMFTEDGKFAVAIFETWPAEDMEVFGRLFALYIEAYLKYLGDKFPHMKVARGDLCLRTWQNVSMRFSENLRSFRFKLVFYLEQRDDETVIRPEIRFHDVMDIDPPQGISGSMAGIDLEELTARLRAAGQEGVEGFSQRVFASAAEVDVINRMREAIKTACDRIGLDPSDVMKSYFNRMDEL